MEVDWLREFVYLVTYEASEGLMEKVRKDQEIGDAIERKDWETATKKMNQLAR